MITKLIGVKELSQNVSKIIHEVETNNVRYIVLRHGKPIAEITPHNPKNLDV